MRAKITLLLSVVVVVIGLVTLPNDLTALLIRLTAVGMIAFYIVPKQIMEIVYSSRDWLTGLRWQLLFVFIMILLASVPTIIIQYLRAKGIDIPEWLMETAKVTGNLSFLAFSTLWVMIYKYRGKR